MKSSTQATLPTIRRQAVEVFKRSPTEFWAAIRPTTFSDVFSAPQLTIGKVVKLLNYKDCALFISNMISEFCDFFSTSGNMGDKQVEITALDIMEDYPYLTVHDLKLFFKMARKSEFGEVYGRIDGNLIETWLKKYDAMRAEKAQEASIRESEQYKELGKRAPSNGMFYQEYIKRKENHKQQ